MQEILDNLNVCGLYRPLLVDCAPCQGHITVGLFGYAEVLQHPLHVQK